MSTVYCDSSALVRRCVAVEHTPELATRLATVDGIVTSLVAVVEVRRALARAGTSPTAADAVLQTCGLVAFDPEIARAASALQPPALRALDAIHIATALALAPDIDTFITYDRRQAVAAAAAGLRVESPGADDGS